MEQRELTKEELQMLLEQQNEVIRRLQDKLGKREGYITKLEIENEAFRAHFNENEEDNTKDKENAE